MTARSTLVAGAVLCAFGVLLGAFGAHWMESSVSSSRLATWETAVRYQMVHGLGLLLLGALLHCGDIGGLGNAAALLLAGVVLFSGSLYLLVLTDTSWLGAVAPFGGISMTAGWVLAAALFLRSLRI